MLAVVKASRCGDFYVNFEEGGEVLDDAGPFPDENDAVLAAQRSGYGVAVAGVSHFVGNAYGSAGEAVGSEED